MYINMDNRTQHILHEHVFQQSDYSINCFANFLSMLNTFTDSDGRMKPSDKRSKHSTVMYLEDVFICRKSTMASTKGIMYFYILRDNTDRRASLGVKLGRHRFSSTAHNNIERGGGSKCSAFSPQPRPSSEVHHSTVQPANVTR